MSRAERRHQMQTAKEKAAEVLRIRRVALDAARIGKAAQMHSTCACALCRAKEQEKLRRALRDEIKLNKEEE